MAGHAQRDVFSAAEAEQIEGLLDVLGGGSQPERRMAQARLRRMGFAWWQGDVSGGGVDFDALVEAGSVSIDASGQATRAAVRPHLSGQIFRVAVGVTGFPVDPDWSAFRQSYHWFGKAPQSITSGAHLFVLAVDRWRSAVVGLYEAVSAGAARLPDSPDPERWPWAVGVRPLAAVLPAEAARVEGQTGPQSGLPERVYDETAWPTLYAALASSPPPPGPETLEQRVQELEWQDVAGDVLAAVVALGSLATAPAVIERAIELGGWTEEQLAARAWYTGTGPQSHIENIVASALRNEHGLTQRLQRLRGGRYVRPNGGGDAQTEGLGVPYRAATRLEASEPDDAPHQADLSALDAATRRHMDLQDHLADTLRGRGIDPRSPGSWEPGFDLAFAHGSRSYVVEVKSGSPVTAQQTRLGVGQILEYRHILQASQPGVEPVLLLEGEPPEPWPTLLPGLGIAVLRADTLPASLDALLRAPD